jgi:hypothetical protein
MTGGTTVTITGENFLNAGYVFFGKEMARSFTVISPTSITAVSPSSTSPTTVDIYVITPGGTSATSTSATFEYQSSGTRSSSTGSSVFAGVTAIAPVRICDTRSPTEIGMTSDVASGVTGMCDNSGQELSPHSTMSLEVAGIGGIPNDATAVVLKLTALATTASSYLSVYPTGRDAAFYEKNTSAMNLDQGVTTTVLVVVPLGTDGSINLYNYAGDVKLTVEATGYFTPTAGS